MSLSPPQAGPDALTAREIEVLSLLAKGLSNKEIAAELGIGVNGVKWHVKEILARLGVDTREEAADYWRARTGSAPRLRSSARLVQSRAWWKFLIAASIAGVAAGCAIVLVALILASGGDDPPLEPGGATPADTAPGAISPAPTIPPGNDPVATAYPGLYPHGTFTGIAEVDRVIAAVTAPDADAFRASLQLTDLPCALSSGQGLPTCDPNTQGQGDIVLAIHLGLCSSAESSWIQRDSFLGPGDWREYIQPEQWLVAVSEIAGDGQAGFTAPGARYALLFQAPEPDLTGAVESPRVFLVGDDGIVSIVACNRAADDGKAGLLGYTLRADVLPVKQGAKHRDAGPFHPRRTTVGIPSVDAVIEHLLDDGEVPDALISWLSVPCSSSPTRIGEPECPEGTGPGTPVQMIAGPGCEPSPIVRNRVPRPLGVARSKSGRPYELDAVALESNGTYVIVLVDAGPGSPLQPWYVSVDDVGVFHFSSGCGTDVADVLARAQRVLLAPLPK